jgi:hypothetical protein
LSESASVSADEDVASDTAAEQSAVTEDASDDSTEATADTVYAAAAKAAPDEASLEDSQAANTETTHVLTLTASEVGDLLDDETPVLETDTELRYQLTNQAYEDLLAALGLPQDQLPDGDTALVVVSLTPATTP